MVQNEARSANCSENESKIYSGTALSSLQISQQDPVSLKRDHTGTGSNVKAPPFNKLKPFLLDMKYRLTFPCPIT